MLHLTGLDCSQWWGSLCVANMGGGERNVLDILRPASNDEVGKSSHFWIIDKGLLESFFVDWYYAGMMDSNIQWKVGAWLGTESREGLVLCCIVMGSDESKYLRVVSLTTVFLTC